ncbi:MAG: phenylpyruvate tautomerase MIF-related protein [Acutalibacteraceae bacterium]
MPFINTKTTCEISDEKEVLLKAKLGQAISLLGKGEGWLMLEFEDKCRMWFKGKNDKELAMVDIALFGKASSSQYDAMTAKVCEIISGELGISPDCIYVKYSEVDHWGYSGFNF